MALSIGPGGIIKPGEFADILQSKQWIDVDPVVWSCNKQVLSASFAPGPSQCPRVPLSRKKTGPHRSGCNTGFARGQGRVRGTQRRGSQPALQKRDRREDRKLRAGCPAALAGFHCHSVWSLETVKRVHERLALGGAQPVSLFCHIQPR